MPHLPDNHAVPTPADGAGNPLADLVASTLAFYARFGVERPELDASIRHFREEADELIAAAQQGDDLAHIGEEAVDVLVTALGVCFACGLDVDQFTQQIYAVIRKNDAKTHETHAIIDGKIRRKPPA